MSLAPPGETQATHRVTNQPPPLEGLDLFSENRPLVEALEREGGGWAAADAAMVGEIAGGEAIRWGFEANENPPRLKTHDRFGNRVDQVDFHPSWHHLMRTSVEHAVHALPWREQRPGAHAARTALFLTLTQPEAGHACPITMTFAAVPALRAQPELLETWEERLTSARYDSRDLPAAEKTGALCGMGMTEKQGGSDVRANATVAKAVGAGGAGAEYALNGHKWFCSAPMCDLFLMLAQIEGEGLSCFAVPRWRPDGSRNAFQLQRLKDKLGNRSNASSEVELRNAYGQLVGEPGRGVATIIEMVNHTRLDCVIGSAAGMRWAVSLATHHAAHRSAFGRLLNEQPLMANVLADLCVESEAATVTAMRLARAYDEAGDPAGDPAAVAQAQAFKRIATAVMKFWVCKRQAPHAAEALEVLGGNGYVEESGLPRLYREAPLNSVWEGSGNVICLDVLRALHDDSDPTRPREAFLAELALTDGADPRLDAHVATLRKRLADPTDAELRARRTVEAMALALQGSLLVRHAPPAVREAFLASRLTGDHGSAFGTLPPHVAFGAIVERHRPRL
ncbi:acyl-CoA dehydrogenase family protein [Conexibacter sp. JD483]|uniref:acyl-CoA dehydrogenase family protein n=1 Tax=unclassified Conexibacter TaxID=2627773 RepID=UPI002725A308|nr:MULTISPECIES: acyl-CoA dehydrogenase family protein [unclassified Conexibacter]MDO8185892.1 acyl-CoA dehydrogenase family protein [Conexibacter sp. CPCC 205706]MDO8199383.1 acyl-CoA dehydrogenase family protein [Conexibacter sp. CPCC 205762]MDR9371283.1 acyl-CoA dehydrogenase family protein [Conexibacter sp. JD483]